MSSPRADAERSRRGAPPRRGCARTRSCRSGPRRPRPSRAGCRGRGRHRRPSRRCRRRRSRACGGCAPRSRPRRRTRSRSSRTRHRGLRAREAATISSSVRKAVSRMTFTTVSPAASTTARTSCSTRSQSPDFAAPMFCTMSSSKAPSARACSDSATLAAVEVVPCGKPITVPTPTPVPCRRSTACWTSLGRTHTLNTRYAAASSSCASTSERVSSGLRMAWSMSPRTASTVTGTLRCPPGKPTRSRPAYRARHARPRHRRHRVHRRPPRPPSPRSRTHRPRLRPHPAQAAGRALARRRRDRRGRPAGRRRRARGRAGHRGRLLPRARDGRRR